jgi:hypothetical protein
MPHVPKSQPARVTALRQQQQGRQGRRPRRMWRQSTCGTSRSGCSASASALPQTAAVTHPARMPLQRLRRRQRQRRLLQLHEVPPRCLAGLLQRHSPARLLQQLLLLPFMHVVLQHCRPLAVPCPTSPLGPHVVAMHPAHLLPPTRLAMQMRVPCCCLARRLLWPAATRQGPAAHLLRRRPGPLPLPLPLAHVSGSAAPAAPLMPPGPLRLPVGAGRVDDDDAVQAQADTAESQGQEMPASYRRGGDSRDDDSGQDSDGGSGPGDERGVEWAVVAAAAASACAARLALCGSINAALVHHAPAGCTRE